MQSFLRMSAGARFTVTLCGGKSWPQFLSAALDPFAALLHRDVGRRFNVVGLPDIAVKESRERDQGGAKNCGHDFPPQSVTVNLAPATSARKALHSIFRWRSRFSLPGHVLRQTAGPIHTPWRTSLDGQGPLSPWSLSAALAARDHHIRAVIVPEANVREAAVVEGIDVFAVRTLPQAVDLINAPESFVPVRVDACTMLADAAVSG